MKARFYCPKFAVFKESNLHSYIKDIKRIEALLSYGIMNTENEEFYETLNSLVSTICNTPISLISFIDDKKQWYKSKIGMDADELPVEDTICQFTLLEDDILEISDTLLDSRLSQNPFVHTQNGIRFYAGISLRAINGHAIGSVCAADFKPQQLNPSQKQALRDVAKMISIQMETKKRNETMELELREVLNEKILYSEKQIQIQEQIYNTLHEAISQSNAIIEFSNDGTILSVNELYAQMTGYSVNELIGQNHSLLLSPDEPLIDWEKLASGKPYVGRFIRKRKDGNTYWVQASYCPVIDFNGEIKRITNISIDITKDIKAINSLEELSNQKDHFIANISHELRSPIHAIIGFTELLLEKEQEEKKRQQLQSVKTAGDTLLYLVNGILDLSKIEAGLFRFDYQDFTLIEVIKNVFSILEGKADAKKLSFGYELDDKIPEKIHGDPNRLTQILINLLDNALKFTDKGAVKLKVDSNQIEPNVAELTFTVSDTGIGIPEDKITSIFGRFTQAESNTTRKYGGTGLGLNICKLLVEKQGGTIFAASKIGEETTFTFTLRFQIPEQQTSTPQINPTQDYSSLSGRILMCEDNPANSLLARQIFATTSMTLDVASNGKEAIPLMQENNYDIILMDIQMPEMDGYQTTEYIRNELNSNVPIIALTAHSIVKEKQTCLAKGMNDYLSKPFKKKELFEKIQFWMNPYDSEKEVDLLAFSLDFIQEASQGNTEFEHQMLQLFLEQSEAACMKIYQWHLEQDWESISKQAHQLKSSFGMLMMDTELLEKLESTNDYSNSLELIQSLEKQITTAHKHIYRLLNKKG